ncbi:MAG: SpoIIE family protein phosphatase [Bacteroidales bacterium]|jgi:sigma-B regulation protein RsbU (phosphoserine phosphatase)|nr:SpoIIE family protein phosphatase [Bacteroidales bacterium]
MTSGSQAQKRLKATNYKLNTILDLTREINQNRSEDYLLFRFRSILLEDLEICKFLFYLKGSEEWECVLSYGCDGVDINSIDFDKDVAVYKDVTFISSFEESSVKDYNIIIPMVHDDVSIGYLIIGDKDIFRQGVSPTIKHLKYIQTVANIIIVAIENIRLFRDQVKQESLRKELEVASDIQSMLIPSRETLPKLSDVDIDFYYKPHNQVGGDYFDVIRFNSDVIGFCIADVSGKGIPAALLMSNFQAGLRAIFTSDISMKRLVHKLNDHVNMVAKGERFVTFFVGRFNMKSRHLEYVNAGHVSPLLYCPFSDTITELSKGCIGLGMDDMIPSVKSEKFAVKRGAKIYAFTDGLYETISNDKIVASTDILKECITNRHTLFQNMKNLTERIESGVESGGYFDDVSVIAIGV